MSGVIKDRDPYRHLFLKFEEYYTVDGQHIVVGRCPCGEWCRDVIKD